jgi:hypothetical protein
MWIVRSRRGQVELSLTEQPSHCGGALTHEGRVLKIETCGRNLLEVLHTSTHVQQLCSLMSLYVHFTGRDAAFSEWKQVNEQFMQVIT